MPFTHLGDISASDFLRDYWQQKPLLVRRALPGFQSPLSADVLAGFALEDWVESRLVFETGREGPWRVEHGPFGETTLTTLPATGWSLLIQGVDALSADVNALLDYFRFLPAWRLDDIMVSVAPDGGSVGPHFDDYDVFLLQGQGRRRWLLGDYCDEDTALIPDCDLRILQNFQPREEFLLEAGDMLYVPPRLAHWGIADGESITYSIGFRAPSLAEMLSEYGRDRAEHVAPAHYRDLKTLSPSTGAAIPAAAVDEIESLLHQSLLNRPAIADWFGRHMTEPRYADWHAEQLQEMRDPDTLEDAPLSDTRIKTSYFRQRPENRVAFHALDHTALLFINGRSWRTTTAFAELIARYETIAGAELVPLLQNDPDRDVLAQLLAEGLLIQINTHHD